MTDFETEQLVAESLCRDCKGGMSCPYRKDCAGFIQALADFETENRHSEDRERDTCPN